MPADVADHVTAADAAGVTVLSVYQVLLDMHACDAFCGASTFVAPERVGPVELVRLDRGWSWRDVLGPDAGAPCERDAA